MKIVLITGCSSGIGQATAIAFARKNFKVIATMRNLEKSNTLHSIAKQEGLTIDIKQLDVTDEQSAQSVVNAVLHEHKKIDILINNAGSGFLGTLEQTSLAQAQEVMDINFFGVWRLTQAVLPSMRQHKSGHIISITSVGGFIGQPFNEAYCAAKFAVEGLMESLAPIVKRFGIQVSLVEPGPVDSEFVSTVLNNRHDLRVELEKDYKHLLDAYCDAAQSGFAQAAQTPDEIAKVILDIAAEKKAHFRYQTSELSKMLAGMKFIDSTGNNLLALSERRLPAEA